MDDHAAWTDTQLIGVTYLNYTSPPQISVLKNKSFRVPYRANVPGIRDEKLDRWAKKAAASKLWPNEFASNKKTRRIGRVSHFGRDAGAICSRNRSVLDRLTWWPELRAQGVPV